MRGRWAESESSDREWTRVYYEYRGECVRRAMMTTTIEDGVAVAGQPRLHSLSSRACWADKDGAIRKDFQRKR